MCARLYSAMENWRFHYSTLRLLISQCMYRAARVVDIQWLFWNGADREKMYNNVYLSYKACWKPSKCFAWFNNEIPVTIYRYYLVGWPKGNLEPLPYNTTLHTYVVFVWGKAFGLLRLPSILFRLAWTKRDCSSYLLSKWLAHGRSTLQCNK